jgi:hypothetical protein
MTPKTPPKQTPGLHYDQVSLAVAKAAVAKALKVPETPGRKPRGKRAR